MSGTPGWVIAVGVLVVLLIIMIGIVIWRTMPDDVDDVPSSLPVGASPITFTAEETRFNGKIITPAPSALISRPDMNNITFKFSHLSNAFSLVLMKPDAVGGPVYGAVGGVSAFVKVRAADILYTDASSVTNMENLDKDVTKMATWIRFVPATL